MEVFWGLIIPFIGTTLGSAMVFLMRKNMPAWVEKLLLGFAAGVMIAASIWSLLIPSLNMGAESFKISWLPACLGFLAGMGFLLLLDSLIPHIHVKSSEAEGLKSNWKKSTMLVLAVTLHNIPEGMAVGITLGGAISGAGGLTMAGAMALSLGIAIQNFPEGAIVAMPLETAGHSKTKAFLLGTLSGAVEPVAAIITMLLTSQVIGIMPYLLSFAAGAMLYVVVEELIPESQVGRHSNIATIGVAIGFALMMVLDVTFG